MTIFLLTRISLKEGRIPIFHTKHFSHQRPLELFQSEGGCRVLASYNVGSWEVQSLRSIMEFIPCREVPSLKLTVFAPENRPKLAQNDLSSSKHQFSGSAVSFREGSHIPPKWKRKIIDSKLPSKGDMFVPRVFKTS